MRPGVLAGIIRPTSGGAPVAPQMPAGFDLYYRESGITGASGDVASWDDEGPFTVRQESPTVGERPALVTVGSVQGAQSTVLGDYARSTATFQLVKPFIVSWIGRIDTWIANDRLLDFDASAFLVLHTNGGNNSVRWEQGAADPTAATANFSDGDIVQITAAIAESGGTSTIYINGSSDGTAAANAAAPGARIFGYGARSTDGAGPADATHLEWVVYNSFADNAAMAAFDLAGLHARGAYIVGQASG